MLLDPFGLALSRIFIAATLMYYNVFALIHSDLFFSAQALFVNAQGRAPLDGAMYACDIFSHACFWLLFQYIATTCNVFLLLGFQTKPSLIMLMLHKCLFDARSPWVTDGGDQVIKIGLLFLIFYDSSKYFAVDAWGRSKLRREVPACGLVWQSQVIYIYFFTSLLKHGGDWTASHLAIYYALSLDSLRTSMGEFCFQALPHALQKEATVLVYYIEEIVPLICVFARPSSFKTTCVLLMILLHICIAALFSLFWFQITMIALWLPLLPWASWLATAKLLPDYFSNAIQPRLKWRHLLLSSYFLADCMTTTFQVYHPIFAFIFPLRAMGLTQKWGLFAPNVNTTDGIFVAQIGLGDSSLRFLVDHKLECLTDTLATKPRYSNRYWYLYCNRLFASRDSKAINALVRWLNLAIAAKIPGEDFRIISLDFYVRDIKHEHLGLFQVQVYPHALTAKSGLATYSGDLR